MPSDSPGQLARLLKQLAETLDRAAIPYMIIGGQAVLLHGRIRVTDDVDLTLGLDASQAARFLQVAAEVPLRPMVANAVEFVQQCYVLPTWAEDPGMRVDFAFSFSPYERQAIARSVVHDEEGYPVRFATAEDLVIHKLFAGRPQDIQDVEGIIGRQGGKLDRPYLRRWIKQFSQLEGKGHLSAQLAQLLKSP